jgi:carbonic anhydrase
MTYRPCFAPLFALALLSASCTGRDDPAPGAGPAADSAGAAPAHEAAEWSYEGRTGPENWDEQYPACAAPSESPIDLTGAVAEPLPPLRFVYGTTGGRIRDTGHSIQVDIQYGGLIVDADTFALTQFHFHLPSEHALEGRAYDGEIHFVHQNQAGERAVVGVFVEAAAPHPLLNALFRNLPSAEDPDPTVIFDASKLLPAGRAYYAYTGSLTTPPCTGGVRWFVLQAPVQASSEQLQALAAYHPMNARPRQPLGDRALHLMQTAE